MSCKPLYLFLLAYCMLSLCGAHIFSPNNSYESLALFDTNETLMSLEDGLDEWHEKFIKPHVDPRFRILTVSSVFTKDDLQGGGWVLYACSKILKFLTFFSKILKLSIICSLESTCCIRSSCIM